MSAKLPPGRSLVGLDEMDLEMALYGDAYVHVSPEVREELAGTSPLDALVRRQMARELDPPVAPACLAGPNAPGRSS
ncbi:hypothetical protein DMC63_01345 [Streptomyces sp. WAC 05977]|nr:hypothetical protein DMC63_01345 [Streptomyces sp. WAC 05977]